jgi:primosomal protein N' (replication factor Y) (superfamily II helicase)
VQRYCRVAIDSPVRALERPFDYEIPERMLGRVGVGSVVRVNLHGRNVRAFVIELLDEPAVAKPRPLSSLVGAEPLFTEDTIALAAWTARRYVVPLGVVLHDAVPGRFSAPGEAEAPASPFASTDARAARARPVWLTDDLTDGPGETCVVLPSTHEEPELVAYAVARARANGRSALVIAPRVDVVERLAATVGGSVVLHGEDKPGERAAAWAAARDGNADVVVGGRSALFVPMCDLGLVLVASAHDRSLRAERTPRLHALHVARQRARFAGCSFVASSPAPPLDIAAAEGVGSITSKRSPVRPETARPRRGPVTQRLIEVVTWAVGSGSDALVFVGRRGDVLRLRCTDCGWAPTCEVCGTGLAFDRPALRCRVCGNTASAPDECPYCGGSLSERGWGHERVARAIAKEVDAPVVTIVKGTEVVRRTEPSVVVGTLAAANSIGTAGAVCVADLDQLLTRPDFRAAEVAIQTLHELAGVLAPGGRFLVQTREPEHHVVQSFTRGSFGWFLDRELPFRRETSYPPFGVVVRMEIAEGALDDLTRTLGRDARVVGAVPRRGRLVALVRAPELEPLLDPLRAFSIDHPRTKIDVDPTDLS